MTVKLRSWFFVVIGFIVLLAIIGFSIAAYRFQWDWAGFSGKTLWDWLTLLIFPFAVAFGSYWLDQRQKKIEERREQQREEDKQHEATLQAYLDKMVELVNKGLLDPHSGDDVRPIARVLTLTVVSQLDAKRKGSVVQFLYESGLIKDEAIIALDGIDLSGAIMSGFQLSEINLSRTDLSGASFVLANLSRANLHQADLKGANLSLASLNGANFDRARLSNANLTSADLSGAYLSGAYLKGATGITLEQLAKAASLKGAIMPDGSTHP